MPKPDQRRLNWTELLTRLGAATKRARGLAMVGAAFAFLLHPKLAPVWQRIDQVWQNLPSALHLLLVAPFVVLVCLATGAIVLLGICLLIGLSLSAPSIIQIIRTRIAFLHVSNMARLSELTLSQKRIERSAVSQVLPTQDTSRSGLDE
jgi:hypothetical protein